MLLIAVTLLSIAAAAAAPSIAQQIKRDREDELIRRGKQYAEAVKRYYIKFHRYPANIDQLVDTNGIRFLRRRYVDPVTGKDDWKLVHQGEATIPNFQFGAGPGIPGGQTPGQIGSSPNGMAAVNPAAGAGMATGGVTTGLAGATGATTGAATSSTSQGTTAGSTGTGAAGTTGNVAGATVQVRPGVGGILVAELVSNASNTAGESNSQGSNQTGSGNSSTGTSSSNSSGGSQPSSSTSATGTGSTFGGQQSGSTFGGQQSGSTFGGQQSGSTFGGQHSGSTFGSSQSGSGFGTGGASPFANSFGAGQQIGGGAIIGVASTSTKQSIREFNGKDHYNEWAFIYDPRLDTRVPGQTGAGGVGTPIAPGQNAGAPATQFGQGTTAAPPTTSPTTTQQPPP